MQGYRLEQQELSHCRGLRFLGSVGFRGAWLLPPLISQVTKHVLTHLARRSDLKLETTKMPRPCEQYGSK